MNVSEFVNNIKKDKTIAKEIRLYLIDNDKHFFVSDGVVKKGFNSKLSIVKNRDSILSAFSKMAFLFDEIMRIRIVYCSNDQKSNELLYLLNLIPVNRKIRTFLDWKVFGPEFTRDMSRLFEVRNDVTHCVSINEVQYVPKDPVSLSSSSGFTRFSRDLQHAWCTLLEIYSAEQKKLNFDKIIESY